MKKNNGVTLIVLAVTIVILTILSGVAINQALGDGGLINKTKDEKNTSRIKLINEAIQSYNLENKLDNYLTEGNGNNVENLMVNILGTNIINMDFAFEIKTALNNNDVEAAKGLLSEQAKYLSAIYEQMTESEVIKSILDN